MKLKSFSLFHSPPLFVLNLTDYILSLSDITVQYRNSPKKHATFPIRQTQEKIINSGEKKRTHISLMPHPPAKSERGFNTQQPLQRGSIGPLLGVAPVTHTDFYRSIFLINQRPAVQVLRLTTSLHNRLKGNRQSFRALAPRSTRPVDRSNRALQTVGSQSP